MHRGPPMAPLGGRPGAAGSRGSFCRSSPSDLRHTLAPIAGAAMQPRHCCWWGHVTAVLSHAEVTHTACYCSPGRGIVYRAEPHQSMRTLVNYLQTESMATGWPEDSTG